jgi:hypothetical protein
LGDVRDCVDAAKRGGDVPGVVLISQTVAGNREAQRIAADREIGAVGLDAIAVELGHRFVSFALDLVCQVEPAGAVEAEQHDDESGKPEQPAEKIRRALVT